MFHILRLRYWKIFLVMIFFIICGCILILRSSNNAKLKEIYDLQSSMSDFLHQKMVQIMSSKPISSNNQKWVPVHGTDGHIFSAYLEHRPEILVANPPSTSDLRWGQIRILAILSRDIINTQELDCIFRLVTKKHSIYHRQSAKVKALEDGYWNLKYSTAFVICDLPYLNGLDNELLYIAEELPKSVGVLLKSSGNLSFTHFIDVYYPKNGFKHVQRNYFQQSIAICVPVLHHHFNRATELIEFIEYYRLMGITHFTFYKASVSARVAQILQYYENLKIITVLPWKLPPQYIYEQTLRLEGLLAAFNDCLYRNSFYHNYKYIGVFDVGEFLVPKLHDNFTYLLKYVDHTYSTQEDGEYASYLFRHAYFYTMYPDASAIDSYAEPYLYTKQKIRRLREIHSAHSRSRYIIRAQDVVEIGNHQFIELREGSFRNSRKRFKEMVVDPSVALLHHYAPCEAEETGCYLKSIVFDHTAVKFTKKLSEMVVRVCLLVFSDDQKCPDPVKQKPGEI